MVSLIKRLHCTCISVGPMVSLTKPLQVYTCTCVCLAIHHSIFLFKPISLPLSLPLSLSLSLSPSLSLSLSLSLLPSLSLSLSLSLSPSLPLSLSLSLSPSLPLSHLSFKYSAKWCEADDSAFKLFISTSKPRHSGP